MPAPDASPTPASTAAQLALSLAEGRRLYWQRTLRLTAVLLAIWFVVTFVVSYFARELDFGFFGWPFSFWVASQGALIVYVLIVAVYARRMNRLDDQRLEARDN